MKRKLRISAIVDTDAGVSAVAAHAGDSLLSMASWIRMEGHACSLEDEGLSVEHAKLPPLRRKEGRTTKGTGNYKMVVRLETDETDMLLIEDLAEQAMEEFMTYLRDYDPGARLFEGEVIELKIGEKLTTKETGNDQEENQQR